MARAVAVAALLVSMIAVVASGCGNNPAGTGGGGGSGGSNPSSGPGNPAGPAFCTEGATQSCHQVVGMHGGIITCFAGTQTCTNGAWGECTAGNYFARVVGPPDPNEDRGAPLPAGDLPEPESPVYHTLSFSDAGACVDAGINDPCDPTCQAYPEAPDGGVAISGIGMPSWQTGSLSSVPPGLLNKAIKQPCYTASDCQFNEFCDPATGSACGHNKCATGAQLAASCDTCVAQVCAQPGTASCCYPAACGRSLCTVGTKLNQACDPCVNAICAQPAFAYCCTGTWDAACVGQVATTCGQTCKKWDATCVQAVHDTCGDFCDKAEGSCGQEICYTGDPLTAGCDAATVTNDCVTKVCGAQPSCCSSGWDPTCTALISSQCGYACPQQGLCKPWLAGQTDPNCPKPDLTLGVPCGTTIPVCNVGTVVANPPPGGIIVHHWPGNSSGMPTCSPNLATGADCPGIMTPIQPGQCVQLNCLTSGNEEMMVNPSGTVNECTCQNNWTINSNAACEPVICTGSQSTWSTSNIDMYVGVDLSVAGATWTQMKAGLNGFFGAAAPPGTKASITFFPDQVSPQDCDNSCNALSCTQKAGLVVATSANFSTVLALMSQTALSPPTSAAYTAIATLATADKLLLPADTHEIVLIIANDPTNCGNLATLTVQAATLLALNIKTYVIGISPAVSQSTIDAIAAAGGTVSGISLGVGGSLGTNLTAALNNIRGTAYPCSFTLPPAGQWDPSNPAVTLKQGFGPVPPSTLTQLNNVLSLAGCNGTTTDGYYYLPNNANPTSINLCSKTCTTFRNPTFNCGGLCTVGNTVKLVLSCPTKFSAFNAPPQIYTGNCPAGTQVQWGYFAYNSVDPSNSFVDFTVQTGQTAATLGAPIMVTRAQSTPTDTQVCPMGALPPPAAGCPIDLYALLGLPAARDPVLQLNMAFNPNTLGTATPTVNNWQITYSCAPDQ